MLTVKYLDFSFSAENPPTEEAWEPVADAINQVPFFSDCMTTTARYHHDEFMDSYKHDIKELRYCLIYDTYNVIVGVVPLSFTSFNKEFEFWEFSGNLSYANYVPPCPPLIFAEALSQLPAIDDEFIDPDYWKATGLHLCTEYRGGFFNLATDFESYLAGLTTKARGNMRRSLRSNSDLEVVFSNVVLPEAVSVLLPPYQDYWREREADSKVVNSIKIVHDLKVFAQHPDQLLAMYVYDQGVPIAANFAWVDFEGRVIDMLCLRSMTDDVLKRGLGIFCVLKNIEECIRLGHKQYTLTSGDQAYKKVFITESLPSKRLVQGSIIDLLFGRRDIYFKGQDMSVDSVYYETLSRLLLDGSLDKTVLDGIRNSVIGLEYLPATDNLMTQLPEHVTADILASPMYVPQEPFLMDDGGACIAVIDNLDFHKVEVPMTP